MTSRISTGNVCNILALRVVTLADLAGGHPLRMEIFSGVTCGLAAFIAPRARGQHGCMRNRRVGRENGARYRLRVRRARGVVTALTEGLLQAVQDLSLIHI